MLLIAVCLHVLLMVVSAVQWLTIACGIALLLHISNLSRPSSLSEPYAVQESAQDMAIDRPRTSVFAITYPASLLVTPTGGLQCVPFHDDGPQRALALFTDQQLAELFCRFKAGAGEYKHVVIPDEQALIDSLRHYEPQLARADVIHVALDPIPGQRLSRMRLQDFIEDLERRPPQDRRRIPGVRGQVIGGDGDPDDAELKLLRKAGDLLAEMTTELRKCNNVQEPDDTWRLFGEEDGQ